MHVNIVENKWNLSEYDLTLAFAADRFVKNIEELKVNYTQKPTKCESDWCTDGFLKAFGLL